MSYGFADHGNQFPTEDSKKSCLKDWIENYEKILPVFLRVLKESEQAAIDRCILKESDWLSDHMLKSWETGDFWLNYAARKSWAFDMIYWAKIDRRFFGDGDLEDRLQLLTQSEREEMDGFVQRKLREKEERTYLFDWLGNAMTAIMAFSLMEIGLVDLHLWGSI